MILLPAAARPARALTIAGTDPSGGAGVQADLKTFHGLGVYGMSVVAALTAQNTHGVEAVQEVTPAFVRAQLHAVMRDIGADAVKTGMLLTADTTSEVARGIGQYGVRRLVVDPVCASKHGNPLLRQDAVDVLRDSLVPLATVVTPNLPEVELLTGVRVERSADLDRAAEAMLELGADWVLVKGGHLTDDPRAVDLLRSSADRFELISERIHNRNTHGTGCTLAAAITAYLARGLEPVEAVRTAKSFVTQAIRYGLPLGGGIGPVNHLWPNSALTIRPGVGGLVRGPENRVLLNRRRAAPGWAPLSGGVEPGESVVQALQREALEELGLTLRLERLVGLYSDPAFQIVDYPTGEHVHYVTAVFDCTVESTEIAGPDPERWAWFDPDSLPDTLLNYAVRWFGDARRREQPFVQ